MSATGRNKPGNERHELDFYETPAWCTRAILNVIPVSGSVLDAGAGTGAILRELLRTQETRSRLTLARGIELDQTRVDIGNALLSAEDRPGDRRGGVIIQADFLAMRHEYDVVIGNPPYNLAEDFIDAARKSAPILIFLLRLNFLGSQRRASKFSLYMPDVYVLPRRPSFTGDGRTDATEYAWFVWGQPREKNPIGRIQILELPPCEE